MGNDRYTIGLDFGTQSARAVLVNVQDGFELASAVYEYENGVISETLPGDNRPLPPDFALHDPKDYLRALDYMIPTVIRKGDVSSNDVIGLGVCSTSCTLLPVYANGRPLCWDDRFKRNPHAWVKLWKHHAAQPEAKRLNMVAEERNEPFLQRYGGRVSAEWFFPKVLEIIIEAPEVYDAADRIIEAGDWITWQLTGKETRNACSAGYKALWDKELGYPGASYFAALHPRMRNVVEDKMGSQLLPHGARAGYLEPKMAEQLGLTRKTVVTAANIDAHATVPAASVTGPNRLVMVMGTSICHMIMDTDLRAIPGVSGVVNDGIMPGFYGYEAGQGAGGDILEWFVRTCVPASYESEARRRSITEYRLLEERAAKLSPGESGLICLDWWNGNRSILNDADLSGMVLGYTLDTTPEEVYLALIEATAFGTNRIIEAYEQGGIAVDELIACGGLPQRNNLLMQVYADVTNRPIRVPSSSQLSALGSAIWAAVAAGEEVGGYSDIRDAVRNMAKPNVTMYTPDHKRVTGYKRLYREYQRLHDYFGRGENDVMKILRQIRKDRILDACRDD